MEPIFFATFDDFYEWMDKNHNKLDEVWIGMYRKSTGIPSVDWNQVVDVSLCFGWIDGIRKSIDDKSYMNRLTPRRPRSIWSDKNIKRIKELEDLGLMRPEGRAAFAKLKEDKARVYSFEQDKVEFTKEMLKQFKANKKAWELFQSMPPSYRKPATWWVISAKQEKTRQKRLETLISDSENGLRISQMRPNSKK